MKYLFLIGILLTTFLNANIVIAMPKSCKINTINIVDVNRVFMGMKSSVSNKKVVAIDSADKILYEKFAKQYLGKNLIQMKIYWTRMIFSGKKKPHKRIHLNELITLKNKQDECYIIYLEQRDIPKSWKRVKIIDK